MQIASIESSDNFGKRIDKFLVDTADPDRAARQQAERSVKFFTTDEGSVGMSAVFPATAGKVLKANLNAIVNTLYFAAHPERADVAVAMMWIRWSNDSRTP